mmetsp:Transcript_2847/g.3361  ORF Transcript_2847/g.3361 Transcript_2847/m.3361 type:complete len:546 (-) Transcript_2847:13-1650(-)
MNDEGSANRRESIHISLGSNITNSFSAHYLNLQGLAATSKFCEPFVTHTKEKGFLVPRCFFLDENGGKVLELDDSKQMKENSSPYLQDADMLAYSKYSRYQAPILEKKEENSKTWFSGDRHVEWGEEEEEEEESDSDENERLMQEKSERREWEIKTRDILQERLEDHWVLNCAPTTTKDTEAATVSERPLLKTSGLLENGACPEWHTFFAPPHPSNYRCILPYSNHSKLVDSWDTYTMGSTTRLDQDWKEDVFLESLRHILEDCDSVQGITIATEGHGIYAGLTTSLLEEMKIECRSAGRLVLNFTDSYSPQQEEMQAGGWRGIHMQKMLSFTEKGLATFDIGQTAHMVIPLKLFGNNDGHNKKTLFRESAEVAMALEAATLAYRRKGSSGVIGGSHDYMKNSNLSFGEFLASLQPSSRHNLLELEFTLTPNLSFLLPGTSIELRKKQLQGRQHAYRQPGLLPGEWIETKLKSKSPTDENLRSLHDHWSMSTAIRSTSSSSSIYEDLQCTMESMDIRYQPRKSLGFLMDQSFYDLTSGGYAAGAY